MSETSLMLKDKIGTLAELVSQFEKGSCRISAELMYERRSNANLRNQCFYTANYGLYRVVDGKVRFAFGEREGNPIFKNVVKASQQLLSSQHDYIPSGEDIAAAVQHALLDVNMAELQLQTYNDEFSYFEIDTGDYERTLNPVQRSVAEAVHGKGDDFKEVMCMLQDEGRIMKTKIYVLNPDYVQKKVRQVDVLAVARACCLDDFGDDSDFFALNREVDLKDALRGVPKALVESEYEKI